MSETSSGPKDLASKMLRFSSGMAVLAVLLNWVTTGDHLIKTLGERYWPVAGVDLFLLASAALAVLAARKLKARSEATVQAQRAEAVHA